MCKIIDGSTSWQEIKDRKDLHPVDTVEYAVDQEIDHKPEFNWWVNAVSKKKFMNNTPHQEETQSLPQEDS